MAETRFEGRRILVVEDEYLIADDIRDLLTRDGAEVVGPVATADAAAALVESDDRIDAALLDVNLRGDTDFAFADMLFTRNVPFAFATGYDREIIPDRFQAAPRLEKPLNPRQIVSAIDALLAPGRSA
jgi:CheY-like chemotaxis protein